MQVNRPFAPFFAGGREGLTQIQDPKSRQLREYIQDTFDRMLALDQGPEDSNPALGQVRRSLNDGSEVLSCKIFSGGRLASVYYSRNEHSPEDGSVTDISLVYKDPGDDRNVEYRATIESKGRKETLWDNGSGVRNSVEQVPYHSLWA